jgi:hypothetical protein
VKAKSKEFIYSVKVVPSRTISLRSEKCRVTGMT